MLLGSLCVRNDQPEECRQKKNRENDIEEEAEAIRKKKSQKKILMTKFQRDTGRLTAAYTMQNHHHVKEQDQRGGRSI